MFDWLKGDSNDKELKKFRPLVEKINSLEPHLKTLSDAELRAQTGLLRSKLEDGASLDELIPQAYAAVREAARRTIGLRHFDVQLMGGLVLHQGKIAEMKTGEGKTLVATLPLYLNALAGKGCHLVTVNDYLARRDAYWMGPVYHLLGVSVASIFPMQNPAEPLPARLYDPDYDSGDEAWRHFRPINRREAYQADITYGTCSDFGFDYLRDNMTLDLSQCVQRGLHYAIVDEVDNLLIDEARTPLIISAPDREASQRYQTFARLVRSLTAQTHYTVNEKDRVVEPTEEGYLKVEEMLRHNGLLKEGSLYDTAGVDLLRHLRNALMAKELYQRDRDYVVKDGEVVIVDEFTGRLMLGRRYAEGLHQAIEAKEGVQVKEESKTLATITIQNYFRSYEKLAGMTGTAATAAEEFQKIYSLDVVVIPTHKPMIREDLPDYIYPTEKAKFKAVASQVVQEQRKGRPVLIGTVSVEKSEALSKLLDGQGVRHKVLNAKRHEQEAMIIARAGEPGAITVATNMAGRGVDIILGGSEPDRNDEEAYRRWQQRHNEVISLGGLLVLGTERHEARRIDDQLRGRAGRQGDPGASRFYVSLEDDLVRRFGGERIAGIMQWAGMDENTPIENRMVSRAIENAQKRVEGYYFDMRRRLVEFDDVVNKQREFIYRERRRVLEGADLKAAILAMIDEEIRGMVSRHIEKDYYEEGELEAMGKELTSLLPQDAQGLISAIQGLKPNAIAEKLSAIARELYNKHEESVTSENMRILERLLMLRTIDTLWVEHLTAMEYMRQGIGFQAMAQQDPLVAYKREGSKMFQELLENIRHSITHSIYRVNLVRKDSGRKPQAPQGAAARPGTPVTAGRKVGRNDPCPCGSGKKYKHCCGR